MAAEASQWMPIIAVLVGGGATAVGQIITGAVTLRKDRQAGQQRMDEMRAQWDREQQAKSRDRLRDVYHSALSHAIQLEARAARYAENSPELLADVVQAQASLNALLIELLPYLSEDDRQTMMARITDMAETGNLRSTGAIIHQDIVRMALRDPRISAANPGVLPTGQTDGPRRT